MKWEGNRESDNVEDRRGDGGGRGGGGFPIGGRSIGIGTVVLALVGWGVFGINPLTTIGVLSGGGGQQVQQQQGSAKAPPSSDKQAQFVSVVLADTEDVWGQIFAQSGQRYQPPKLVLFSGAVATACGAGITPGSRSGNQRNWMRVSCLVPRASGNCHSSRASKANTAKAASTATAWFHKASARGAGRMQLRWKAPQGGRRPCHGTSAASHRPANAR